jgi:glucokinase
MGKQSMESALIGDIGATNARFALLKDGLPTGIKVLPVAAHASLQDAIETYFRGLDQSGEERPRIGAVAVAGPVTGDFLSFTNHPWSFSISALARELAFDHLDVINDFVAVALAVPRIGPDDRRQVGAGSPETGAPVGIIGPGTGLGVSIVVPVDEEGSTRWVPLSGEGGHVTLSAITERETALVAWMHRTGRAHVSAETFICGKGLTTIYAGLSALDGIGQATLQPADVSGRAISGEDPIAVEAVDIFCGLLGTVAGNLALTAGARGGIYIAGGIVPKMEGFFDKSQFRPRFIAKGRMRAYLEPIPTYVVTAEFPAFLGLAEFVESNAKRR